MDLLLDLKEAAIRLRISPEHVKGLIEDGRLPYINIGRGKKRPRYRFCIGDLDAFIEANRQREEPCQFSKSKSRRTTLTNSSSKVIGFAELRAQRTAAKRKR